KIKVIRHDPDDLPGSVVAASFGGHDWIAHRESFADDGWVAGEAAPPEPFADQCDAMLAPHFVLRSEHLPARRLDPKHREQACRHHDRTKRLRLLAHVVNGKRGQLKR